MLQQIDYGYFLSCIETRSVSRDIMDSAAAFKERSKALGISADALTKLEDAKLATFGQFAFLSTGVNG